MIITKPTTERESTMSTSERMQEMKAATFGLIRKIEREDMIVQEASEVYTTLSDYMRTNYPEFTSEENDDCVYYAMQASLF
jgi:hypothetical protein